MLTHRPGQENESQCDQVRSEEVEDLVQQVQVHLNTRREVRQHIEHAEHDKEEEYWEKNVLDLVKGRKSQQVIDNLLLGVCLAPDAIWFSCILETHLV